MSNCDEINSCENQQLPTFKDPKGCLDITTNHQKDDDTKKIVILNQDPKGCQDITMGHQKDDPKGCQDITIGIKKIVILNQDSKRCQDITIMDHQKYDHDTNKIEILQQDHPKACQDITMDHQKDNDTNNIVISHQALQPEDDDDGFRTPTSLESKIPILTTCPPAPKHKYSGIKRKASSPRRGKRNIRVWIDYRHRDTGRF